jgi:hypothetical protein
MMCGAAVNEKVLDACVIGDPFISKYARRASQVT